MSIYLITGICLFIFIFMDNIVYLLLLILTSQMVCDLSGFVFFFFQDKSLVHTGRIIRQWLQEQRDVELLNWPNKGCDLNPIEDIWANMNNVRPVEQEQASLHLLEQIMAKWEHFRRNPDIIYNYVASVPNRLKKVITNNGGWIKN